MKKEKEESKQSRRKALATLGALVGTSALGVSATKTDTKTGAKPPLKTENLPLYSIRNARSGQLTTFDINTKQNKNQELSNLYKVPRKEKGLNMPKFQFPNANIIHQADLLFMPSDNGFKYALVVVDVGSRLCDAVPLKTKSHADIIKAFTTIYTRRDGKLKYPSKRLEVDAGSEFGGAVKRFFEARDIYIRVALPGRHRQQAIVERKNQTIGHVLHQRMAAQELLTGETSREWVEFLPRVIKAINDEVKLPKQRKEYLDPVGSGESLDLIPIGTKVRVMLDSPVDVAHEQKLYGKFRKSDIRYNQEIRTVKEFIVKPGFPPMYLLDGNIGPRKTDAIARTKQQLQIVDPNEEAPEASKIMPRKLQSKTFVIQKILDKKKVNNRIYYSIKWKGFPQPTLEPRSNLIKMVPKLIKEYDDSH